MPGRGVRSSGIACIDHPGLGKVPIISPEDLILAKLEWSDGGRSELQMRDCRSIIRLATDLDWDYLERHAPVLGVDRLLEGVRDGLTSYSARSTSGSGRHRPRIGWGFMSTMYRLAFTQVWAAARSRRSDDSSSTRLAFVLRRLYPDLEGAPARGDHGGARRALRGRARGPAFGDPRPRSRRGRRHSPVVGGPSVRGAGASFLGEAVVPRRLLVASRPRQSGAHRP